MAENTKETMTAEEQTKLDILPRLKTRDSIFAMEAIADASLSVETNSCFPTDIASFCSRTGFLRVPAF